PWLVDGPSCIADCQLCVSAYKQTLNGDMASDGIRRIDDQNINNRKAMSEAQIIAVRNVCPTQALSICGEAGKSDDLLEVLMKGKPCYEQSQGSVKFSGGEPLMRPNLVAELAERLHQNHVSTAVESCM
ncbi:pyruvate formate lyase-activating protein, partial [Vibrio parahaemolyticus]